MFAVCAWTQIAVRNESLDVTLRTQFSKLDLWANWCLSFLRSFHRLSNGQLVFFLVPQLMSPNELLSVQELFTILTPKSLVIVRALILPSFFL